MAAESVACITLRSGTIGLDPLGCGSVVTEVRVMSRTCLGQEMF